MRDRAVVSTAGERAAVAVTHTLDEIAPSNLVLITASLTKWRKLHRSARADRRQLCARLSAYKPTPQFNLDAVL